MRAHPSIRRVLAHVVAAEVPVAAIAGKLLWDSSFSAYARSAQGEGDMVVAGAFLGFLFVAINGSGLAMAGGAVLSFIPRLHWLATFGVSALVLYLWLTP